MQDVADDEHTHAGQVGAAGAVEAVAFCLVLAQGYGVEQCLGGVCVSAVARVEYGDVGPACLGEALGCAGCRVADHERIRGNRFEGLRGVLERLALRHGGARSGEVGDGCTQALLCGFEGETGSGGVLEEEVDDGLAVEHVEGAVFGFDLRHVVGDVKDFDGFFAG